MQTLSQLRCLHHPAREAVARCPECGGFFCRECITEHEDRVICANCLKQLSLVTETGERRFAGISMAFFCALAFLIVWLFFYETGKTLLLIPASFHDGTLWHSGEP